MPKPTKVNSAPSPAKREVKPTYGAKRACFGSFTATSVPSAPTTSNVSRKPNMSNSTGIAL
jgi:hypothetical protein